MARGAQQPQEQLYRVREGFGVPGEGGYMRAYATGAIVRSDDPIVKTHSGMLEPASNAAVEAATAAPGERRDLRLPSGRSLSDVVAHRTGHAHTLTAASTGDTSMPFRDSSIGSDDPRSPASTFAPAQPAAGVVAPDVPDAQNLAGAPRAGDEDVDVRAYVETGSDPRAGAGPVPRGQTDPGTGEEAGATGADADEVPVAGDDGTAGPAEGSSGDDEDPAQLRGAALDEALKAEGLSTSGTVAEKQARLGEARQQ